MFALYTSRKQGKLQRARACGGHEIHVCKSSLFAPVVLHIELHGCRLRVSDPVPESSCADPAFLPPSSLIDIVPNSGKIPLSSGASQFAAGYDDIGRAARKALILSKITTFRVVKTTTLISVK